ncbi:MAG TPA: hypothetical protein VH590_09610 [Ktedonobacterales bacterium]|jgi:hypothetical protein
MIDTLRQVIQQVEQLGPDEQCIIAERFQRVLEELADAEYEAGETEEGGWVLP